MAANMTRSIGTLRATGCHSLHHRRTDMDKDTIARLRAALELIGSLPISRDWMQQSIRHCVRNMDLEDECDDIQADTAHMPRRLHGDIMADLLNALPALLSIAERAADVEGMAKVMPELWTRENGFATPKEHATAASRYVLGGE